MNRTATALRDGHSPLSTNRMAEVMGEAHTRLCLMAVELIAEHFIWKTPEAKDLLGLLPPLQDARLDCLVADIRNGAVIPCDCTLEQSAYLAEILIAARRIQDFDTRRERIEAYQRMTEECGLLYRLAASWQSGDRADFKAVFEAFQEHLNAGPEADRSEFPWEDVAQSPPVPEPLFQNGPAPGGFGLIVGADGVGKGWLTLDLILGCVLARPMNIPTFRRQGTPLRVNYLCYEDDPRVLRWRLDRVCECAGIDPDAWRNAQETGTLRVAANLAPLFIQGNRGTPEPTAVFRSLKKSLKRNAADLCIIDPLAAATVLQSENDNSAVNAVAVALRDLARDTCCTILLTHHTSKANRDAVDHHASRGGSALTGAARWVLRLIQNGNDRTRLTAGIPKNSYGRGLGEITLQRLDKGVLRELSGTYLGKQKEALVEGVARFVEENPEIEINPKAVRRNCSPGAKALIAYLDASSKAASEAVERALNEERVQLEERRRTSNNTAYQVLVPWQVDEEDIPF